MSEFADLWDVPDAKRERRPGAWDLYCADCGHFVDSVASPVEPHSVRCRRCRIAATSEGSVPRSSTSVPRGGG